MNYFSPKTTSELFELLGSVKNYTILSGGTDLMPRFESGTPLPENLIVLKKISICHLSLYIAEIVLGDHEK